MPSRNDTERGLILESEISTARLVELALILHTRDFGDELYGRSHAWYAIDITRQGAREFLAAHDETGQRRMASSALVRAGWTARAIAGLAGPFDGRCDNVLHPKSAHPYDGNTCINARA